MAILFAANSLAQEKKVGSDDMKVNINMVIDELSFLGSNWCPLRVEMP